MIGIIVNKLLTTGLNLLRKSYGKVRVTNQIQTVSRSIQQEIFQERNTFSNYLTV